MSYYKLNRPRISQGVVNPFLEKDVVPMTPNEDGSCKKVGCSGLVKKMIFDFVLGMSRHEGPYCDTCDSLYITSSLIDPCFKRPSLHFHDDFFNLHVDGENT